MYEIVRLTPRDPKIRSPLPRNTGENLSALIESTDDMVLASDTERKRMEAALLRSEEKFAKAFSSSPIITTISDFKDDDRLIEVNAAFEEVTGYRREEVIGRTTGELKLWYNLEEFREAVRQFRERGSLR